MVLIFALLSQFCQQFRHGKDFSTIAQRKTNIPIQIFCHIARSLAPYRKYQYHCRQYSCPQTNSLLIFIFCFYPIYVPTFRSTFYFAFRSTFYFAFRSTCLLLFSIIVPLRLRLFCLIFPLLSAQKLIFRKSSLKFPLAFRQKFNISPNFTKKWSFTP